MPITLADVEARLKAISHNLRSDSEVRHDVALLRINWLLDMWLQLTRPPVAPLESDQDQA